MLSVKHVTKLFHPGFLDRMRGAKEFLAVDDISFDIKKGTIVGLLGPNGAGKTTTMHMLLSTLTPTSGTISYFGKDFATHRSELLQKIGFASTYINLPGRLTVQENLEIYGRLYGLSSHERKQNITKLCEQFGVQNQINKQVNMLSAGQTTRVMLVKAFLAYPEIVLLDEPTAALDPDIAADTRKFILDQQKEYGTTILLASHNMDEVTQMCDRVLVMQHGKIIDDDKPENLAARMNVSKLVLLVGNDVDKTIEFAQEKSFNAYQDGHYVHIELPEDIIAAFLQDISKQNITYTQIYIERPSLEDYFLSVARQIRGTHT